MDRRIFVGDFFSIFDPPFRITMEGGGWAKSYGCVMCIFTVCQAGLYRYFAYYCT